MSDAVPQTVDKLLRLSEVLELVPMSKSTIYAAMRDGTFPQSVRLRKRGVAWRSSAIDRWLASRTSEGQA